MFCEIVQMADAPAVAVAQPLPPSLLIGQSLYPNILFSYLLVGLSVNKINQKVVDEWS